MTTAEMKKMYENFANAGFFPFACRVSERIQKRDSDSEKEKDYAEKFSYFPVKFYSKEADEALNDACALAMLYFRSVDAISVSKTAEFKGWTNKSAKEAITYAINGKISKAKVQQSFNYVLRLMHYPYEFKKNNIEIMRSMSLKMKTGATAIGSAFNSTSMSMMKKQFVILLYMQANGISPELN